MPDPSPAGDFPPVEVLSGALDAGVLFLCDHASNAVPPEYGDLGLPAAQFQRHIAYDIGAAAITRALARAFAAPAVLTTFSRLLIDPNRGADDPTLVMRLSDGALIPGNARIGADEVERRRQRWWEPYRDAVAGLVDAMQAVGPAPALVAIHSFTPFWKNRPRPWQVGVLWDADARLAEGFIAQLRADGIVVGDNEPYDGALEGDTLHAQATSQGLANMLIEVRQDLIADEAAALAWARRLEPALRSVLAAPSAHIVAYHGSRAGGCFAPRRITS